MLAYRFLSCPQLPPRRLTAIARICVLVLHLLSATLAQAADLSDCGFHPSFLENAAPTLRMIQPPVGNQTLMKVTGNLRNGVAQTYSPDDAVLVADVTLTRTRMVVTPTADIRLKSSMLLGLDFYFPAHVPIPVIGQVRGSDGQVLLLIMTGTQQVLFIDHTSHFCNRSINMMSRPYNWTLGTLTQQDPDAALSLQLLDADPEQASVRIIFGGISGGQMRFEELWVRGGRVIRTLTHTFDQFVATINIGPFTFEVIKAGAGGVTLRYDIPALAPVERDRLLGMQMKLHPAGLIRRSATHIRTPTGSDVKTLRVPAHGSAWLALAARTETRSARPGSRPVHGSSSASDWLRRSQCDSCRP